MAGNVFMPSVASSLNAGSRDNLLDLLQQRLLQQQMQQQLFAQQRQGQQDLVGNAMRFQSGKLAQDRLAVTERAARDKRRMDEDKAAEEQWTRESRENALISAANMPESASFQDRRILAQEAGAPMSAFDLPERKETPAERSARLKQDEVDKASGKAEALKKFPELKPTKVAKGPRDSPRLPDGVKAAIKASKGRPGWGSAREAFASVSKSWGAFLGDHPDLDRDAVRAYIGNLYNERLTPTMVDTSGGSAAPRTISTASDMERRKANVNAKIDGLQSY